MNRAWPLRAHRREAIALLGFVLLAVLLFSRAWSSPRTRWVGSPGDPALFMWYLRWYPWALAHGQNPLFTHHMNFPDGVNLMWNTSMPLASLALAPVTLSLGPVFAYNLLVTLAVALSAWCAYLMLRRYVRSHAAAFVGGLLYGFSPYMVAHAGEHPNLPLAFIPPLLVLVLDEILVTQHRSPLFGGTVLGCLAAAQLLLSEELLATEMLVACVALVVLVIVKPEGVARRARHAALALETAVLVAVAIAGAPLAFQFFGPMRVRGGSLWSPDLFTSDLLSFVVPTRLQHMAPAWSAEVTANFTDRCCPAEWNSYLGAPLVVFLTVAAVRLWSNAVVRVASLVGLAVVVLSMGPHLHVAGHITRLRLPLSVFADKPVLGNIIASRLMLYAYLMAAVLVAIVIDLALRSTVWHPAAVVAGMATVLTPLFPRVPFGVTPATVPSFFRSSAVERVPRGSVAVVAPFARDTSTSSPMLWQAEADMRYLMPEGYALGPARSTGRFIYLPEPSPLSIAMEQIQRGAPAPSSGSDYAGWRVELQAKRVSTVIVGPMGNREAMVEFFRSLLGRDAERVGGVEVWHDVDRAPAGL